MVCRLSCRIGTRVFECLRDQFICKSVPNRGNLIAPCQRSSYAKQTAVESSINQSLRRWSTSNLCHWSTRCLRQLSSADWVVGACWHVMVYTLVFDAVANRFSIRMWHVDGSQHLSSREIYLDWYPKNKTMVNLYFSELCWTIFLTRVHWARIAVFFWICFILLKLVPFCPLDLTWSRVPIFRWIGNIGTGIQLVLNSHHKNGER